jgi:hypothetical protein
MSCDELNCRFSIEGLGVNTHTGNILVPWYRDILFKTRVIGFVYKEDTLLLEDRICPKAN